MNTKTAKHTPGPIYPARVPGSEKWTLSHEDHNMHIALVYQGDGVEGTHDAEANAHRLAAAWNACAGIPTEALESGVVRELLKALKLQAAYKMRDGTPCNCPAGRNEFEQTGKMPTLHATGCEEMRAAIAKAEGQGDQ